MSRSDFLSLNNLNSSGSRAKRKCWNFANLLSFCSFPVTFAEVGLSGGRIRMLFFFSLIDKLFDPVTFCYVFGWLNFL